MMDPKDYVVTQDAKATDTDLDQEPITLPDGTILDEDAAETLGEQVAARAATRRRGRPSLTGAGVHSPKVSSRITPELRKAIDTIAERDGIRPTEVVRHALEEYVAAHQ
ncbi:MAG: CopG family transcriptional regulator [Marmoricola sp.]